MSRRFYKIPENEKKICRVCKEEKEIPQKWLEHGDYICRECLSKYRKEYRKKNLVHIIKIHKDYYKRTKTIRLESRRKYLDKLRIECATLIGDKCIVCGCDGSKRKIDYHEIHGKNHPLRFSYIREHYKDFVPLCYIHHKYLHSYTKVRKDENLVKLRELSLLIN